MSVRSHSEDEPASGRPGPPRLAEAPAVADLPQPAPPAPMSLSEYITAAHQVQTPPELWDVTLRFFQGRGVVMMSYHYYGSDLSDTDPLIRAEGFPEDWVNHYVENKLFLVDPIPELAARSTEPFFWSDVGALTQLLEREEAYLEELQEAKLGEGLGVPVFGPMASDGYVGLGFGGTRPALRPRDVRELQMAAQVGHLTYCGMMREARQVRTGLSPREREVLHWIARGKSNGVISDIMRISPHTVDTHVRRIFEKLDVTDRTTAAVKGLGAGLLMQPPAA